MAGMIMLGIVAALVTAAALLRVGEDEDDRNDRYRGW